MQSPLPPRSGLIEGPLTGCNRLRLEHSCSTSSRYSFNNLIDYYALSPSLHSTDTPSPIPSITLSPDFSQLPATPQNLLPSTVPDPIPASAAQDIMPSASSLPHKIGHLCSRLKSSSRSLHSPSENPSSLKNSPKRINSPSNLTRPSPVKVPPSSVGLDVDPRSWVQSDDSENESDDETLVKNGTAPTSLGDDDEVPLSRLRKHASGGLISPVTPTVFDTPSSGAHARSQVMSRHRSSRSLHSLYKKPAPPPHPPYQMASQNQAGHPINGYAFPQALQPPNPIRTLRPAMSSPNLSRERLHSYATPFNLASFPMPPAPPSQVSPVGIHPSRFTPSRGHSKMPSQNSQLATPPSSVSPPARTHKLSSPQSSVSFRPTEKEVHRRMKQRHKEDLHQLHQNYPGSNTIPTIINIDPSLYSMLNDSQRSALRQRSDVLAQNLKIHLEAFAYEMVHANLIQQQQQNLNAFVA